MNKQIQATPTKYDGVEFKSKSEAIFARNLDLRLNESCISPGRGFFAMGCWEYEPEWLRTRDGWVPDFIFHFTCRSLMDCVESSVIEYKPSKPTSSYLDTISRRFDELRKRINNEHMQFYVVWGSKWNPPMKVRRWWTASDWENQTDDWEWSDEYPWLGSNMEEAAEYRFDLE